MAKADFYLYFPDEAGAREAGRRLEASGYEVDVRLGADDVNWLALALKDIDHDDLWEHEERLTALATELGGEYDGHEIDVS